MRMTKARLDLLQAVDDGAVRRVFPLSLGEPFDDLDRGPGVTPRWVKVTGRLAELDRAGLVRFLPREWATMSSPWVLTDAGRAVLEAHRG